MTQFGPAFNRELYSFGLACVELLGQRRVWPARSVPNLEPSGVFRNPLLHTVWSTGIEEFPFNGARNLEPYRKDRRPDSLDRSATR